MRRTLTIGLIAIMLATLLQFRNEPSARAQALDCPEMVKRSLQQVQTACATVPRNNLCFGSSNASVQLIDSSKTVRFEKPGDTVPLADLKQITVNPYDAATNTWGAALMRLQANLPDTAPGQAVTMLLMGDVSFGPDGKAVAAGKGANAFYFKTGSGTPACKGMPASGILLESPQGKQRVQLTLNGVQLDIGSKVFIEINRTRPQARMKVYTLKGLVRVTNNGKTVSADDNDAVAIPVSDDDYAEDVDPVEETGTEDLPPYEEDLPVTLIDTIETEYDGQYPEENATEAAPPESTEAATPDAVGTEPAPDAAATEPAVEPGATEPAMSEPTTEPDTNAGPTSEPADGQSGGDTEPPPAP